MGRGRKNLTSDELALMYFVTEKYRGTLVCTKMWKVVNEVFSRHKMAPVSPNCINHWIIHSFPARTEKEKKELRIQGEVLYESKDALVQTEEESQKQLGHESADLVARAQTVIERPRILDCCGNTIEPPHVATSTEAASLHSQSASTDFSAVNQKQNSKVSGKRIEQVPVALLAIRRSVRLSGTSSASFGGASHKRNAFFDNVQNTFETEFLAKRRRTRSQTCHPREPKPAFQNQIKSKVWMMKALRKNCVPLVTPTNFKSSPEGREQVARLLKRRVANLDWSNLPKAIAKRALGSREMCRSFMRKARKYYRGVVYLGIKKADWKIIDVRDGPDSNSIVITVEVPAPVFDRNGKEITKRLHIGGKTIHTTQISVHDASSDTRCLAALGDLSMKIHLLKQRDGKGNCRGKGNDNGLMTGVGWRDSDTGLIYKPTHFVKDSLEEASVLVGAQMRQLCPEFYDKVRQFNMCNNPLLGGHLGTGQQIMVSENYSNSAHIDPFDQSPTYVSYAYSKECPPVDDHYFLFPDVTKDGRRGLAIKLFHGAVVVFDGRILRHCTSVARPADGGEFRNVRNHTDDQFVCGFGFVACKSAVVTKEVSQPVL